MRLLQTLLRTTFFLLYHPFAWTYDLVAATVSLGRWQEWVHTSIPHLSGQVLEIGFGPGHLQASLIEHNPTIFGLDESTQMCRQAARRLKRKGAIPKLVRGYAQNLPFKGETFNSVVATFPSEYIFDPYTLIGIRRVLYTGGDLVIIPTAWITGGRIIERLAAWVFNVTGEAPGKPRNLPAALKTRIVQAGFNVRSEIVEKKGSQVLLVIAKKT